MTTPRKNFNYNSPYARPVKQYPSQSEDYISFDMGGLTQSQQKAPCATPNEKTPGRYGGTCGYYQQNYGNSHNKANRRNLFNNNIQQNNRQQNYNQQQTPRYTPQHNYRKSQDSGGQQKQHQSQQRYNNKTNDKSNIAAYVHPSMTEDPWFELMQRIQSLRNSTINLEAKSSKETTPPPSSESSSPNTDSDNANDNDDDEVPADGKTASSED